MIKLRFECLSMAVGNIELLIDASQLPAKTKTSALFKGIKQNVESSQHNSHIKDIIQNNLTYQKKKNQKRNPFSKANQQKPAR